jgi:ATP-dependent DNA ligase
MLRPRSFIKPWLPSPAKEPPSGDGWLHEIKHDGIRIMARRDSAGVRPPVMAPTSLHGSRWR